MPTVGNPIFNWDTPCLEQELIKWENVVDDNFRVNKIENEYKAALIRGWIGNKGSQYLCKYEWTKEGCKTMRWSQKCLRREYIQKVEIKEKSISLT